MKWMPYGPDAWLLQFASGLGEETYSRGRAIVAEVERRPPPGLIEYVPAFSSMLFEFAPGAADESSLRELTGRFEKATRRRRPPAPLKEIPVIYDGPDLERVANLHRLRVEDVPAIHAAVTYHVYALGFAPGFPYLGDLDERLHTPRLSSPRPRVPAGAVAIGGEHTGIYPLESPGGWNLIGRTPLTLFDPGRASSTNGPMAAFLLHPGDLVRFVPQSSQKAGGGS